MFNIMQLFFLGNLIALGQATAIPPSGFLNCTFKFGKTYQASGFNFSTLDYMDLYTYWSPKGEYGLDPDAHWPMLNMSFRLGKTPVFYGYTIAHMAKRTLGLVDCNLATTENLCTNGSQFIRDNRAAIVANYRLLGSQTAQYLKLIGATGMQTAWNIEPDFVQYYVNQAKVVQAGGFLSGPYMRALYEDIAQAIKANLTNALIAWNVSPWLNQANMQTYWSLFANSTNVDYIFTSGTSDTANTSRIRPASNMWTWKNMTQLTGRRILANTGSDPSWTDPVSLNARIADGVFGVTQQTGLSSMGTLVSGIRSSLSQTC